MRALNTIAAAADAAARREPMLLGAALLLTVAVGFLLPRSARSAEPAATTIEIERSASSPRVEGDPVAVRFEAFGRRFDLALERHDGLVREDLVAQVTGAGGRRSVPVPAAWIGRGEDGSEARLVIERGAVDGFVRTGAGTFVISPQPAAEGLHDVRRAEDVVAEAEPLACATSALEDGAATLSGERAVARLSDGAALRVLEVSLVADAAYAGRHGDAAVRDVVALANTVDAIYRAELGIALQVVQLVVYTDEEAQPFSNTTEYGTLLGELSIARSMGASLEIGAGGVTHLLTGRRMDDGVMGLAWLGGACDALYGAGYSAVDETTSYLAGIVVAHEIGHGLGAAHDGEVNSGCEDVPAGYVMSPILRRDLVERFSDCSRARVAAQVSQKSCLAGLVPETCGNGVVDAGEDCDASAAGDQGCCRIDCRLTAAGLPCGDSGEECLDAVCDGAGECVLVANEASCTGDDACFESRCEDGACVTTDVPRGFDEASAKLRVTSQGMVDRAKLSGSAALIATDADPIASGVVFVASLGGAPAWNEHVPAERWVARSNGNYSYRAGSEMPGHVKSAKIRLDAKTGRAKFRVSYARPVTTLAPAPPEVLILSGDAAGGQCATGVLTNCSRRGGNYRCE